MRRPLRDSWPLLLAALAVLGFGAWIVARLVRDRVPHSDLTVYLTAGEAARAGGAALYTAADVHGWHYTMPPPFAVCAVPLTWLPIGVAGGVWYAISIALLWGSALAAARLLTPPGSPAARATVVVPLLLIAEPLLDTLSRSQMGVAMLALCVLAFARHRRGHRFTAGALVGVATALKVYAGVLLLLFAARRDWRTLAGTLVGGVLFGFGLPAAAFGPRLTVQLWGEWFRGIVLPYGQAFGAPLPFAELQNHRIAKNQSLYGSIAHVVELLRGQPMGDGQTWLKAMVLAFGLALLAWLWRAWRRLPATTAPATEALAWSSAMIVGLLLLPTAWSHYFVLLLLPLMAAFVQVRQEPRAAAMPLRRALWVFGALMALYVATSIVRAQIEKVPRATDPASATVAAPASPAPRERHWLVGVVMVPRSIGLLTWGALALLLACRTQLQRAAAGAAASPGPSGGGRTA